MMPGDTIYIHGNSWLAIRYKRWDLMQAIRYTDIGIYGREYDMQRWDLMAGNTICREGNRWQAIRNTELGILGR